MEVPSGFPMKKLPIELKLKILECSTGIDLAKLECVSSKWKALIRSSSNLWKEMCYKIMEKLPKNVNRNDLPPEGLNWKELFALWTVVIRNKEMFCLLFHQRNVDGLNELYRKALPCRSPVRYYVEFFPYCYDRDYEKYLFYVLDSVDDSYSNSFSHSGSSAYNDREVTIAGPWCFVENGERAASSGTAAPAADADPAEDESLERGE